MKNMLFQFLAIAVLVVCVSAVGTSYGDEVSPFTVKIIVSPKNIVLGSDGQWITVHTDIALSIVDRTSLALNGVPVAWTDSDAHGNLVAKFNKPEIDAIIAPPGALLTLTGATTDGVLFSGADEVTVMEQRQQR